MTTLERARNALACVVLAFAVHPGELDAQQASKAATRVHSAGAGWQLVDADPGGTSGGNTLMWEVTSQGLPDVPVSETQKALMAEAFADDPDGPDGTLFASQEFFQAMEQPDFPAGYEKYIDVQALAETPVRASGEFSFGCSWSTATRNKSWPYSENLLDRTVPFSGGPVSGQLNVDLPVSGELQVAATYKIRKCAGVPVGFKFVSATASGTATLAGTGSLAASVVFHPVWQHEELLAEPHLGDVSFTIGWIPVRLVFTLPIYAGARFSAKLEGELGAQVNASASGTFSYTCTTKTCSGTSDFTDRFELTGPTASVTLDATARVHARVMLRVALFDAHFAYVEGGAEAHADASLWGYFGNGCGDGDGDGTDEWVQGLTADLGWGYQFAYGMGGWLLNDDLKYTGGRDYPLGFRDLLGAGGSTALSPIIEGPASVAENAQASYAIKMRPCYPYTHDVNFTMAPGVWTGGGVIAGPPAGSATVTRAFAAPGSETLVATAIEDAAGRQLASATSRTITVTSTAPAAPGGLSAAAPTASAVALSWSDNSADETSFEVHRRLVPGGSFALLLDLPANTTGASDTSVQPETAYEYKVRARSSGGVSGYSNAASVTTPAALPAAPSGLTATVLGAGSVRLDWTDNATNETSFALERRTLPAGTFALLASLTVDTVTYTDVTLAPATGYEYRVRATGLAGTSAYSNTAAATTNPPGSAPAAADDVATAHPGVARDIDVTANDSDPDGNPLALTANPILVAPTKGTAVRLSASSVRYTPNTGGSGTDRFQYEVGDGTGWRARAWVTVTLVNGVPVAVDDNAATRHNTAVNLVVTANDADPDGDALALITAPIVVAPLHGTAVRLSGSTITYTPTSGYVGADTFQYEIGDSNGGRGRAWVTLNVTNATPVAVDDATNTRQGTSVNVVVTANDSDPDGDAVTLITAPVVVAPLHGTAVKLSGSTITYTPASGYVGGDTFQYEIGDSNGARARAWVTINVTNAPPVAVDDTASTRHNTAASIVVTVNDSDPDGDAVTLITAPIVVAPTHGTAVKASGSTITYTPASGYVGCDTFQYEIGDGLGSRARAWVNVCTTNAAPVAVNDAVGTRRNIAVSIVVTANDFDPDGDAVTLIGAPIVVAPAHGTATKVSGSTISYTPATGYTGTDTFQYEIGDGFGSRARAWVTVTVSP